jgi:DNA polymerase-3 subunit delta
MIVKFFELKRNLKNKNFFLLYGINSGLIEETINNSLKPNLSKNVYNYDENDILANTDNFKEDIQNKSFFEEDKLIIISRVSDKILTIIQDIIEKELDNICIILKANILDKKSKIRNFFEKDSRSICAAFYEDNFQTLSQVALSFFKDKNINISRENLNLIIERARNNRINLKNELEKIENFYISKQSLSTKDILRLTNLAENYEIPELIDNCLLKNEKKTLNILNENNVSVDNNMPIIRIFLLRLKRLLKIQVKIKNETNIETAMASYKPPIFWKEKEIVKQQLKILSEEKILELIYKLNELELLIKKNQDASIIAINNFIIENSSKVNN